MKNNLLVILRRTHTSWNDFVLQKCPFLLQWSLTCSHVQQVVSGKMETCNSWLDYGFEIGRIKSVRIQEAVVGMWASWDLRCEFSQCRSRRMGENLKSHIFHRISGWALRRHFRSSSAAWQKKAVVEAVELKTTACSHPLIRSPHTPAAWRGRTKKIRIRKKQHEEDLFTT